MNKFETFVLIAALMAVLYATGAFADGVIQFPQGPTVLKYTPCTSAKVLALVVPELHTQLKAAAMLWDGVPYEACWVQPGGESGDIFLVAEDGSYGAVPRHLVKFDLEV